MRSQLMELGCPPGKAVVHHLGVDPSRFRFIPRRLAPGEPVRIVSLARLAEKKGIEYGIRAVAEVAKSRRNLVYEVIGDGPLRPSLQKLIDDLEVGDVVRLAGWKKQDEVVRALEQAHLLMAPSVTAAGGDQEGTPTAIVEAMMMGLPILSTLHSGIPEMIRDGVSGYLVPERDVDSLADRLGELVAHPETWPAMGAAGRASAEEEFNINRLNDRLVVMYEELAGG
jgi:colanic acid/amylovoran biosynthesis glycosyltransferase